MWDVLVVDDEELVRGTLLAVLEEEGLTVREAGGADEALELSSEVDCCGMLVTDIDLGSSACNGFQLADKVRARHPSIPILFISGRSWQLKERPRHNLERQLPKPFGASAFTSLVRELLALNT